MVSPLDVLGYGDLSQRIYGLAMRTPGITLADLSWMTGSTSGRVEASLAELQESGLIQVLGEAVHATAPSEALVRLIEEQESGLRRDQARLAEAREAVHDYVSQHAPGAVEEPESVRIEVIHDNDFGALLSGLLAETTGDMLWLRPDQWLLPVASAVDLMVATEIGRGRVSRSLYPVRAVEEAPDMVRGRAELGEQIRLVATLPTRMAIFGSELAVLPAAFGVHGEGVLLIRQASVVAALRAWFEALWSEALVVPGLESPVEARRMLLQQLSGGVKDEQIARNLGVSLRTVRRRVAELMDELGAQTRFQAGLEAVRRGWI